MRNLSTQEVSQVSGGTLSLLSLFLYKPKKVYAPKPKCTPKPVCQPKPKCTPKPPSGGDDTPPTDGEIDAG